MDEKFNTLKYLWIRPSVSHRDLACTQGHIGAWAKVRVHRQGKKAIYANLGIFTQCTHANVQIE